MRGCIFFSKITPLTRNVHKNIHPQNQRVVDRNDYRWLHSKSVKQPDRVNQETYDQNENQTTMKKGQSDYYIFTMTL